MRKGLFYLVLLVVLTGGFSSVSADDPVQGRIGRAEVRFF